MADITMKLLWFKLGETFTLASERYNHLLDWYDTFSWYRVDFLDMLFLGWLLAAFTVVGVINLYLKFFGHANKRTNLRLKSSLSSGTEETVLWLNGLFSWFSKHYKSTPEFVDAWIRSLNEQIRKTNVSIACAEP